ncbi:GNAT family N-acetyltransferase [Bartonella sp. LJL80]
MPDYAWIAEAAGLDEQAHNHFIAEGLEWVCLIDSHIIGFLAAQKFSLRLHIVELSVAASCQRRGAASELLAYVEDYASDEGFHTLSLTTFRDVAFSRNLYEKHGFRVNENDDIQIPDRENLLSHFPRISMLKGLS